MKKFLMILLIIPLILCSCTSPITDSAALTVYFFHVGQADSSLLIFPDGLTVLIDAGNKADGDKISNYLTDGGIDEIDYFICTHPHEDHIGGAPSIFDDLKINNVCMPYINEEFLKPTEIYKELLEKIDDEGCETVYLSADTLVFDKTFYSAKALAPGKDSVYSDLNDYSICLKIDYYTNTLLFMGDAETNSENEILSQKINLNADILKVGHHGSRDSTTKDFLDTVKPQVAVISCGKDNSYNHPHTETLERLNSQNVNIYRTDMVGTVIAKLYDGGFNIETDKYIDLNG